MEGCHTGLGDVFHSVNRPSADMKNQRNRDALDKFNVQVAQIAFIILAADEVTGRVVGERERICTRLDLGDTELHSHPP